MTTVFSPSIHLPSSARFVAIDGGGGAGKSTLAQLLAGTREDAVIIAMDDFERPRAERQALPPPGANSDLPRLIGFLERLHAGQDACYQRYDWDSDSLAEWVEVPAAVLIILEGVFSTSLPLLDYSDFRIWLEAPAALRLARGLARDGEATRSRWVNEWLPTEETYMRQEDPRASCDLVLDSAVSGSWSVLRLRKRQP